MTNEDKGRAMNEPNMMFPWHRNGTAVYDCHQNEIVQCHLRGHAVLIVAAVNSHADLLTAAKLAIEDYTAFWVDPSRYDGFVALQAAISKAQETTP